MEWEEALAVHRRAIVIDGCSFFCEGYNQRLETAGVTALQMTIPWPDDDARRAMSKCGQYFRLFQQDNRLTLIETVEDITQCKRDGKVGLIFGAQSARFLEEELALVEIFHRIGVRVIQLTYNERNFLGDGCLEPANAGLSRYGRQVIRELNRIGIQIDLTHVGERTSLEALEASEKPCIFSHSNPRARADNPRNLTDEQIRLCAARGGVIGVSPYAPICWRGGDHPPTLEDLIGHIEYMVDLIGVDHLAIGTDSEATPGAYPPALSAALATNYSDIMGGYRARFGTAKTEGFESMEGLPTLTHALLNRGWSETDLLKLLGGNLLRAYAASWG